MVDLSLLFWLFVGLPIITAGLSALGYIAWHEYRFKREMQELSKHRGWE